MRDFTGKDYFNPKFAVITVTRKINSKFFNSVK